LLQIAVVVADELFHSRRNTLTLQLEKERVFRGL
jgi:hypothetical protein